MGGSHHSDGSSGLAAQPIAHASDLTKHDIDHRLTILTLGLVWQFALVIILVRWEAGNLRGETLRTRLWLGAPRDPGNGHPNNRLWWFVLPLVLIFVAKEVFLDIGRI
jgi:hypothetical protein